MSAAAGSRIQSHLTVTFPIKSPADRRALAKKLPMWMPFLPKRGREGGSCLSEGITAQPLRGGAIEKLVAVSARNNGALLQSNSPGREQGRQARRLSTCCG